MKKKTPISVQSTTMKLVTKLKAGSTVTILASVLLLNCCASSTHSSIPQSADLSVAMNQVGRIVGRFSAEKPKGTLVVIKDRHSTRPGFHRVRPQLRQVQKDNRKLVEYLVRHDFRVLGCEQSLGEIKLNDTTKKQYALISGRMKQRVDLDEYAVFQPIRFQILWGDRLSVWGVEDKKLFEGDIEDFKAFARARQRVNRNDISAEDKKRLQQIILDSRKLLRKNITGRGEKAAENLLQIMEEQEVTKGILLVGGAHVPAAVRILLERDFDVYVFESSRYANEDR